MIKIHAIITPNGYTKLELESQRHQAQEADDFYEHIKKHLQVLEDAAKAWEDQGNE